VKHSLVSIGTKLGAGSAFMVAAAIVLCVLLLKGHAPLHQPDGSTHVHVLTGVRLEVPMNDLPGSPALSPGSHQHKSLDTSVTRHLEAHEVRPKDLQPASYAAVDD